jgi:hypothetical protein
MQKIRTIFERDWTGDKSLVIDKPHPDCAWVFAGEGVATQKYDGTSCLVKDGKLYKRLELKAGKEPADFILADNDPVTQKIVGWTPVGDGPEDRWHREALALEDGEIADGTYELLGPKIQGNPEGHSIHVLQSHSEADVFPDAPRTFDDLKVWLSARDIEGLVFHHPDGRMAKIKKRDFGLKRIPDAA